MIRLLDVGFDAFEEELTRRVAETPYSDIRITHGCVFGNIDPEGTRLTDLAERAFMTKQSVGEVVSDLEKLGGTLERVPDPGDGRAKIIRLTERGREARAVGMGFQIIDEIEAGVGRAVRGRTGRRAARRARGDHGRAARGACR